MHKAKLLANQNICSTSNHMGWKVPKYNFVGLTSHQTEVLICLKRENVEYVQDEAYVPPHTLSEPTTIDTRKSTLNPLISIPISKSRLEKNHKLINPPFPYFAPFCTLYKNKLKCSLNLTQSNSNIGDKFAFRHRT